MYEVYEQGSPQFRLGLWRQVFSAPSYTTFFAQPEETKLSYVLPETEARVLDRVCSKSYIAVQTRETQAQVRAQVKEILERGEDKVWIDKEAGVFEYPYNTYIVVMRRK